MEEQIVHIFKEFLARVAKLEELVTVGSKVLSGFQQGLEFVRRPPASLTSELVKNIIKANDTKRLQAYVQAGCTNIHDSVQSIVKLGTCQRGLQDYIVQAKCLLDELNGLIEDATNAIQISNEDFSRLQDKQLASGLDQDATNAIQIANEDFSRLQDKQLASGLDQEADLVYNMEASSSSGAEVTDYACMMGIIYCMLIRDYKIQEQIVSSLNLKSSSAELETYCLMWSLRPFINDEILCQAWKLIP